MRKLSNRDLKIANQVIDYASFVIDDKNSTFEQSKQALDFISIIKAYYEIETGERDTRDLKQSQINFLRDYIAIYRINQKREKEKQKLQQKINNVESKKRKALNASKFAMGGLLYHILSKNKEFSYQYQFAMSSIMFLLNHLTGLYNTLNYECEDNEGYKHDGWERANRKIRHEIKYSLNYPYNFCILITKEQSLQVTEGTENRNEDTCKINFKLEDGYLTETNVDVSTSFKKYDIYHPEYRYPEETQNFPNLLELNAGVAHFLLICCKKKGLIEYDELTKQVKPPQKTR